MGLLDSHPEATQNFTTMASVYAVTSQSPRLWGFKSSQSILQTSSQMAFAAIPPELEHELRVMGEEPRLMSECRLGDSSLASICPHALLSFHHDTPIPPQSAPGLFVPPRWLLTITGTPLRHENWAGVHNQQIPWKCPDQGEAVKDIAPSTWLPQMAPFRGASRQDMKTFE